MAHLSPLVSGRQWEGSDNWRLSIQVLAPGPWTIGVGIVLYHGSTAVLFV